LPFWKPLAFELPHPFVGRLSLTFVPERPDTHHGNRDH
jgi:hypothetical protein